MYPGKGLMGYLIISIDTIKAMSRGWHGSIASSPPPEEEPRGLEPAPIGDAGAAGGDLACYTTVPALGDRALYGENLQRIYKRATRAKE